MKKEYNYNVALIGAVAIIIAAVITAIVGPVLYDLYESWTDKPKIEVFVSPDVVSESMKAGNYYMLDFKVKNIGEETAILRSVEVEVLDIDNYTPVSERSLSNNELESNYAPLLKRGLKANMESKNNKTSYLLKNEGLGPALNVSVIGTNVYESNFNLGTDNFNENSYIRYYEPSNLTQRLGILFNETLWNGNISEGDIIEIQHTLYDNITIYPEEAIDYDLLENNSFNEYSFYDKIEYYDLYGTKQTKYAAYAFIEINDTFYGPLLGGEGGGLLNTTINYDVVLSTSKKCPYVQEIPISHYLEPNEADRFSLKIGSDNSADFEVNVFLVYDDQKVFVNNENLSFLKDCTDLRPDDVFLSLLDQDYWY